MKVPDVRKLRGAATSEGARARSTEPTIFPWPFLTALYVGSALNPVNSSLLATALVPIAAGLHIAVGQTAELVTSLYLASAIAQPTAGKLAEEFGARRIFFCGIILVFFGGLLGGLGNNLATLVVARVLIGVGTSAGYPCAMLLIRKRAEDAHLGRPPGAVLGGLQVAAMVLASLGLPLGGILVDAWGWRTTFLVNVPFTLLALGLAFSIPRDTGIAGSRDFRAIVERIDMLGIAGFAIATATLMGFLFSLPHANWLMLFAGILAAIGLFTHERRASRPFFDVRLLATNGALSRTYLRMGMTTFCIYTIIYGFTQWLQAARNVPAREAGLLLLPLTLVSIVITPIISPRNLIRGPLIAAAAASFVGSIGVLLIGTTTAIGWVIAIAVIFGLTLGMGSSPNQLALYGSVPEEQLGTASGLLRTFGYVGSIASSGMIGVAFHGDVNDGRLHVIGGIMAVVSVLTLALTLADRRLLNRAASTPLAAVPKSGS